MSIFLAPYLDLIPLGASITTMQNTLVGNLTANGWQLLAQVDGLGGYSDLIPPATEPIGTSQFREVVRIYFPNNTTVTVGSYQVCIADAFPQSIRLTAKTAGAVQAGVTIDGVTVLGAVGSANSTANDNLQALYYALMDSADPTITGWTFTYDSNGTLICTARVPAAMVACSGNANVNYFAHGQSVLAGARSDWATVDSAHGYSVTTDLTNGFVYYMSVTSRSFVLATKCISGAYGPIFASYADHANALSCLPDSIYCTPIELFIGTTQATLLCKPTHYWGIGKITGSTIVTQTGNTSLYPQGVSPVLDNHPFLGSAIYGVTSDASSASTDGWPPTMLEQGLSVSGVVGTGSPLDAFYRIESTGIGFFSKVMNGAYVTSNSVRFAPQTLLPDIAIWVGSEPIETCAISVIYPPPTTLPTLAQALDATTVYQSILLSSTAGLPVQGGFIIGSEGFTYTGISGASVTGVTRGVNGTTQARHFVGHVVSPATWYLKVNNGAICCGPNKPV